MSEMRLMLGDIGEIPIAFEASPEERGSTALSRSLWMLGSVTSGGWRWNGRKALCGKRGDLS